MIFVYIFLGLIILMLVPVIMFFLKAWRLYRRGRAFMRDIYGSDDDERKERRRQHTKDDKSRPRKKIDPDVGEYVSFEEIAVTQNTTVSDDGESAHVNTETEAQIVDVEWEDIPAKL